MPRANVCAECGLDYGRLQPPDVKVAVRSFPRRFRQALVAAREDDAPDALIRRRPDPTTWSALEYAAHVADVFDAFADMIRRMYNEERPRLDFFDSDAKAEAGRYNDQDPQVTLQRLGAAAERLATQLDRVDPEGWRREATFPWGERDLVAMARLAVHEGAHHLRDLDKVLGAARRATR